MYLYPDYTLLIFIVPAMIFALYAQTKISSAYREYSQVYSQKGLTGYDIARFILDSNHLQHVVIEPISGELTDHYDPRSDTVRLSEGVYGSSSIAAIGVAAHECGHAIQHSVGYVPLVIRNAIIPITNFGSQLAIPILLLGFVFGWRPLVLIGIIGYALLALFQLITLPVEFNASSRALKIIKENQLLVGAENAGAKKVLTAAALTYVAALLSAVAQVLRLIALSSQRYRNNK